MDRPPPLRTLTPEDGLICGFRLAGPDTPAAPISLAEVPAALAAPGTVLWLHFNLSNLRARRWLAQSERVPPALHEALAERDDRGRVQVVGAGLLAVIHDLAYDEPTDPAVLGTLWVYADARLLLSARAHPLRSTDELRLAVREGLHAATGVELAAQLLDLRNEGLSACIDAMAEQVNEIEDDILVGGTSAREELGRLRRGCVHLRRQFGPERSSLHKLLQRPPAWLGAGESERLREVAEQLGFVLDDQGEVYERAKLLQEELASRVAEDTNRNLYVISVLTAVFLPMTLITGIFGMNVENMPLTGSPHAFGWVMLTIVGAGAGTLAVLLLKKLL